MRPFSCGYFHESAALRAVTCQPPFLSHIPCAELGWPVADVVAGGVVISAVYAAHSGTVEVHADCRLLARVPNAVDASIVGQYGRGTVAFVPLPFPDFLQPRMVSHGPVVQALVALLEDAPQGAGVGSPGSVIVDPGRRPGRPHEHLQRVR